MKFTAGQIIAKSRVAQLKGGIYIVCINRDAWITANMLKNLRRCGTAINENNIPRLNKGSRQFTNGFFLFGMVLYALLVLLLESHTLT